MFTLVDNTIYHNIAKNILASKLIYRISVSIIQYRYKFLVHMPIYMILNKFIQVKPD